MYRLTVHVTNESKVSREDSKPTKNAKGEMVLKTKDVLFNTISYRNISSLEQVEKHLVKIRENHTIQKGNDFKKKDKYNKELIYIRHEK